MEEIIYCDVCGNRISRDDHGEIAGPRADIAGPYADGIRRDHAGAL